MLQLALDTQSLAIARRIADEAAESVDVIEVGTLLMLSEGLGAVRTIRSDHPEHVVVADIRIVRAGAALARLAIEAGANWVTAVAEAPDETIEAAVTVAERLGGRVQVELGSDRGDELIRRLTDLGVGHVIVHIGNEAHAPVEDWSEADLADIDRLAAAGMCVSVTGGLSADSLVPFVGRQVGVVIAGRAIAGADDVPSAAREFREAMVERALR